MFPKSFPGHRACRSQTPRRPGSGLSAAIGSGAKVRACRAGRSTASGPVIPTDIYRAVRHLARTGRIGRGHLRVLAHFGLREAPPDARRPDEIQAARLWAESLDRLTTVLRGKAIVS